MELHIGGNVSAKTPTPVLITPEDRAREFLATRKTLEMATVGPRGTPTASYAPFVYHDNAFFVYTSQLSQHTKELAKTKKASVLLIADEANTVNLFARKRITFTSRAKIITRGSLGWVEIMDRFEKKFGDVFSIIRPLGDFTLFQLTPKEAIYVEGFGRAYRMKGNLTNSLHIKGTGPGAKAYRGKKEPGE